MLEGLARKTHFLYSDVNKNKFLFAFLFEINKSMFLYCELTACFFETMFKLKLCFLVGKT